MTAFSSNVADNPHIVLGNRQWAIGVGSVSFDEPVQVMGALTFYPVIEPPVPDKAHLPVDFDNIEDMHNPAFSLLFATVDSAERLIADIQQCIEYMRESSDALRSNR